MEGDVLNFISGAEASPEAKDHAKLFIVNLGTSLMPSSIGK